MNINPQAPAILPPPPRPAAQPRADRWAAAAPDAAPGQTERVLISEDDLARVRCMRRCVEYGMNTTLAGAGILGLPTGGLLLAAAAGAGPLASTAAAGVGTTVINSAAVAATVGSLGICTSIGVGVLACRTRQLFTDLRARDLERTLAPHVSTPNEAPATQSMQRELVVIQNPAGGVLLGLAEDSAPALNEGTPSNA